MKTLIGNVNQSQMENAIDQLIDSHYEDSIELKDNKFLIFKRITDYRQTDRSAATVYLEDRTLGTMIELGTYFDASWKFLSPITSNLFWVTVKSYQKETKEIFDRVRSRIPGSRDIFAYKFNFLKLKDRATDTLERLKKFFDSEV